MGDIKLNPFKFEKNEILFIMIFLRVIEWKITIFNFINLGFVCAILYIIVRNDV